MTGGPRHSAEGCCYNFFREFVMSIQCEIILKWSATPSQLTALGAALWRWCHRAAGFPGNYQFLDNQALADLIAGKLPASRQIPLPADKRGVLFQIRDEASHNRRATI